MVHSIGSKDKVDFEEIFHKLTGCEVHTLDPTVLASDFVRNNCETFQEWGLAEDRSPETRAPSIVPDRTFEPSSTHT